EGRERVAESSRQQTATGMQASRQQYGSSAQASRQQYGSSAQAERGQNATGVETSARQDRGSGSFARSSYCPLGAGAGLAAATGAAIGAAAAYAGLAAPSTGEYSAGGPCSAPTVVSAGNMKYFQCGAVWYTQAYGPSGPTFVQVAPPAGY